MAGITASHAPAPETRRHKGFPALNTGSVCDRTFSEADSGERVSYPLADPREYILKFAEPVVRARVRAEKLSLAVPPGVMVEPPCGESAVPGPLDAPPALDRGAGHLTACGRGPVRRRPY